jgi:hypothetical protein
MEELGKIAPNEALYAEGLVSNITEAKANDYQILRRLGFNSKLSKSTCIAKGGLVETRDTGSSDAFMTSCGGSA